MKAAMIACVGLLLVFACLHAYALATHAPITGSTSPAITHTIVRINQLSPSQYTSSQQYYVTLARQDAVNAGINPTIFVRQMNEESGFNPDAVSPAGAVGIAQFMPQTAQGLGIDPHNPVQSLQGAARLMRRYLDRYQGSYAMALACYNAGCAAVSYAVAHGGANWQSWLPTETRRYIHTILGG